MSLYKYIFNHNEWKKEKEDKNKETLSDIVRGIQYSINAATDSISQHYVKYLDTFFEKTEDNQFKAKTIDISLDNKHKMVVPVISLTEQSGLSLKKMKVRMAIEINESQIQEINEKGHSRTKFKVQLAPNENDTKRRGKVVDVEMEFESSDPPEGVMKVVDYFNNTIQPQQIEEKKDD